MAGPGSGEQRHGDRGVHPAAHARHSDLKTTAILLGAFQNYGIQPGPQLFTTSAALVWALIASLYIGNVMLLILNLPMVEACGSSC